MKCKHIGLGRAMSTIAALCLLIIPVACGAQLFYDSEHQWSNSDPNLNVRRSEHFRFIWGNGKNTESSSEYHLVTEELVQGNLQQFEHGWHAMFDPQPDGVGFRAPNESLNPAYRDGKFYRANLTLNNTGIYAGGGWGTVDNYGFPWFAVNPLGLRYDPQPDASFHEYLHTVVINAGGFNNTPWDGMWHECTIDWLGVPFYWYAGMGNYSMFHNFTLPNGRAYYDAWLLPQLLYEDPRYGTDYIVKLWTEAKGSTGEYIFDAMVRLHPPGEPDPYNAIKDLIGQMAARNVTWDYQGKQYYRITTPYVIDGSPFNERIRRGTTALVPQPGNPTWYRVPFEHAPCQGGYNICPIELHGKSGGGYTVTIDFQPLWDAARKSDWRAYFVAVNGAGDARYSSTWNSGVNSITLSADENILYLVVSAVPDFMPFNGFNGPLMTDAPTSPQAYRVAFLNTAAKPYLIRRIPPTSGVRIHPNGGGTVALSATVDATAYVGPNAYVYDSAKVLGNARVEDYAQVLTSAQVRDNAVVSGHAVVKDRAQVYGNAKVRDWAMLNGDVKVYGNGKVLEHGYITNTVQVYGDAIIKGCAMDFGDALNYGCAMKDADCSNYADISKGVLMGWVWDTNQGRADALPDNNYMYCGYDFDKVSPNYALDKYGITYGYLMGNPQIVNGNATNRGSVLSLNGTDQYVELQYGVSDFKDWSVATWIKWTGGAADQKVFSFGNGADKYLVLTPSDSTGKVKFAITTTGSAGEQTLVGTSAIPANTWTHVAVTLSGDTGTLYVNGAAVATNPAMTLNPDDCNGANIAGAGNWNFIGRGNTGGYLSAQIDDFRIYYKALTSSEVNTVRTASGGTLSASTDTTPPTPNAATWLVAPKVETGNSVSMVATKGTDASNYVEYYFTCTSGGGQDSGWMSSNKYFNANLTPGNTYTYTVKMRDKFGNTTATSAPASVTVPIDNDPPTPNAATFAIVPKGISTSAIRMTATVGTDASPLVEYRFSRVGSSVTSGWQASNIWTDTGLTSGATYSYTVQMRDAYGNVGTASAAVSALARDDTPPARYEYGEWTTMPYATIDNCMAMRARSVTGGNALSCNIAGESVEYYFQCVSANGPDSGWISTNVWKSPVMPVGTYSYRFKIRDKSPQKNETQWSAVKSGSITRTTGYHACTFADVLTLPDSYLVTFNGTVMRVNPDDYLVRDMATGATVTVKPHLAPVASNVFRNVQIKGHLHTLSGVRLVTTATVTASGSPTSYTVSGRVINSAGVGVSGATIYFSDAPNASVNPVATATADANGYYSRSIPNGTSWYVCAGSSAYNTSLDQMVTVNGANVPNINFTLTGNSKISGKVTRRSNGTAVSGASVYFSTSPNAGSGAAFTATTNAAGEYSQPVQNGTWYVSAGGTGFYGTADQVVVINATDAKNVNFSLRSSERNIPRTEDLLFSVVTDTFPNTGATGNWATYLPSGQTLSTIGQPTVEIINGIKWEQNFYAEADGYRFGSEYNSSIPINGATIILAARPIRSSDSGNWRSIVDIFYDRLVFGVHNNTGQVCVRRNGGTTTAASNTAIPNGQITILSLVVQPDGKYKVWANGTQIMNITTTSTFTSLVPAVAGAYAKYINIGRNNPDSWTTYNGNIGDVFVYKAALTDAERQQLEADLTNKFLGCSITATAGEGGSISPNGLVSVDYAASQTFTIIPDEGYVIADVKVNNVSVGAVSSYTFSNVTANHTISAAFVSAAESVASIDALKARAAGTMVTLTGPATVIYAPRNASNVRSTSFFYIGEKQALGGLRVVDKTSDTLTLGNQVSNLTGYVRKPAGGEVYLELITDPTGSGNTPILPLGMNNKTALTDAKAKTNAVRIWGRVKSVNGTTSFTINDGHIDNVTVIVNGVPLPSGFDTTKTVVVTGVLSADGAVQAQSVSAF